MPPTELTTSPPAVRDPVSDVPPDWPGLWLQMLRARDGGTLPGLRHEPEDGWMVQGPQGERALAWVRERNAESEGLLQARPGFDWRERLPHYWQLIRGDRPVGTLLLLWPLRPLSSVPCPPSWADPQALFAD